MVSVCLSALIDRNDARKPFIGNLESRQRWWKQRRMGRKKGCKPFFFIPSSLSTTTEKSCIRQAHAFFFLLFVWLILVSIDIVVLIEIWFYKRGKKSEEKKNDSKSMTIIGWKYDLLMLMRRMKIEFCIRNITNVEQQETEWKRKRKRKSVWCFKLLWIEEEKILWNSWNDV